MFRDTKTMLQYEAKRSPALADMIANIHLMSEADIQTAHVKMPWIRQALLELKNAANQTNLATNIEQYIVDSVVPDPVGESRRWLGDTTYIKIGKRKNLLEIRPGQLVWFDGKDGVWIDTVYSEVIDPALMAHTESCGTMTRLAYMAVLRESRNKSENVPYTQTASAPTTDARAFVIFRPS